MAAASAASSSTSPVPKPKVDVDQALPVQGLPRPALAACRTEHERDSAKKSATSAAASSSASGRENDITKERTEHATFRCTKCGDSKELKKRSRREFDDGEQGEPLKGWICPTDEGRARHTGMPPAWGANRLLPDKLTTLRGLSALDLAGGLVGPGSRKGKVMKVDWDGLKHCRGQWIKKQNARRDSQTDVSPNSNTQPTFEPGSASAPPASAENP